jgi:hypothetical protein
MLPSQNRIDLGNTPPLGAFDSNKVGHLRPFVSIKLHETYVGSTTPRTIILKAEPIKLITGQ